MINAQHNDISQTHPDQNIFKQRDGESAEK